VGKAWAPPREDDSHSSFAWREGALHGVAVPARRPFHAALRVAPLVLSLVGEAGAPLATRALEGASLAEATAWARAEAERLAGPARQPARPAPDLPPHPLAGGARFSASQEALSQLAGLLSRADTLLRRFADAPPRCWPHHFDLATLVPLAVGPGGALAASLGLGVAVPDAFAAGGYWYASPWSASPAAPHAWPLLPHGRWAPRGAGPPLGVLALEDVASLDPAPGDAAVAAFLAGAAAAARERLAG